MHYRYVIKDLGHSLTRDIHGFSLSGHQARMALKTALSCTLAALAAMWLNLEHPYWPAISALIVSQPHVGAALTKGIQRGIGTVAGATLAIPTVALVSWLFDSRLLMVAVIFLLAAITLDIAYGRRDAYAWMMGGFTALSVCLATLQDPTIVVKVAYYRAYDILLGIGCAWLVHLAFLYEHATDHLADSLGLGAHSLKQMFFLSTGQYLEGAFDKRPVKALDQKLMEQLDRAQKALAASAMEGLMAKRDFLIHKQLIHALAQARQALLAFFRQAYAIKDLAYQKNYAKELEEIQGGFGRLMDQVGGYLENREGLSLVEEALHDWGRALDRAREKYRQVRRTQINQSYETEDVLRLHLYLRAGQMIYRALGRAVNFREIPPPPRPQPGIKKEPDEKARYVWLISLSMALVPLLWMGLDLPGISTISISAFIIFQPDPVETQRKGILRLSGCIAGGTAGLLFLGLAPAGHFFVWLPVLFGGIFFFAYLANGAPGHAYLGLQGALCFMLTLVQQGGPAESLKPPVERLAAILVAALLAFTLNALTSPESPEKRLEGFLAACLEKTRNCLAALSRAMGGEFASLAGPSSDLAKAVASARRAVGILERAGQTPEAELLVAQKEITRYARLSMDMEALRTALEEGSFPSPPPGFTPLLGSILENLSQSLEVFFQKSKARPSLLDQEVRRARNDMVHNIEQIRRYSRKQGRPDLDWVLEYSTFCVLVLGFLNSLSGLAGPDQAGL